MKSKEQLGSRGASPNPQKLSAAQRRAQMDHQAQFAWIAEIEFHTSKAGEREGIKRERSSRSPNGMRSKEKKRPWQGRRMASSWVRVHGDRVILAIRGGGESST